MDNVLICNFVKFTMEFELENGKAMVLPMDIRDFNSGRCRLSVCAMKKNGLKINEAVCIGFKRCKFYCKVWPNVHSSFPHKQCVQFDPSVALHFDKNCPEVMEVSGSIIDISNNITPLKTLIAVVVEVVVFTTDENVTTFSPRVMYNKARRQSQVDCILRNKVFTKHCWISVTKPLNGGQQFTDEIQKIFVCDVYGEKDNHQSDVAFITSKATNIVVKSIKRTLPSFSIKSNICLAAYGDIVGQILDAVTYSSGIDQNNQSFLLLGPPGVGKTSLVTYLAYYWNAELFVINGGETFGAHIGESEANLRAIFECAREASKNVPCVIFMDELDVICAKRSQGNDFENRVLSLLLSMIDNLPANVILIGSTNRPNALDSAIRRPGRFDKEFVIGVPNCDQRKEMLVFQTKKLPLSSDVDLDYLAKQSLGYVSADLTALVRQATINALMTRKDNGIITKSDFESALKAIVPSTYRGIDGLQESVTIKWEDIAGYDHIKQVLKQAVEWPFLYPESFSRLGLSYPRGLLLYGPPGCSKTTLIRAAATSCKCTFLSLSCAQLYSPYVGDAERIIREVFTKARAASPAILFFDEVDAVVKKRSMNNSSGVEGRILSTLLNEIDGVGISSDVYHSKSSDDKSYMKNMNVLFVAATNRPDVLDEAILRPGRIDRIVYVPPPDITTRTKILQLYCMKMPLSNDVNIHDIAANTKFFSGADLKNFCREAVFNAMQEFGIENCHHVQHKHFLQALSMTAPSLSQEQIKRYEEMSLCC